MFKKYLSKIKLPKLKATKIKVVDEFTFDADAKSVLALFMGDEVYRTELITLEPTKVEVKIDAGRGAEGSLYSILIRLIGEPNTFLDLYDPDFPIARIDINQTDGETKAVLKIYYDNALVSSNDLMFYKYYEFRKSIAETIWNSGINKWKSKKEILEPPEKRKELEEVERHSHEGLTIEQIAKRLSISKATVNRRRKELGITKRSK